MDEPDTVGKCFLEIIEEINVLQQNSNLSDEDVAGLRESLLTWPTTLRRLINEDQCADCPGRTMPAPFTCQIPQRAQDVIGPHSGFVKKMEIMITKCHHKERIIEEAPGKLKILDELEKKEEANATEEKAE